MSLYLFLPQRRLRIRKAEGIFLRWLFFLFVITLSLSFSGPSSSLKTGPGKLLNKKVPIFSGFTIDSTFVDTAYFKDKVTLITFMYIGCPPCMKEIHCMNLIHDKYITSKVFQLLCISPHIESHLRKFNSNDSSVYSIVRNHAKAEQITYETLPECKYVEITHPDNHVGPECDAISSLFKVNAYPTAFLVDQKGIIRKIFEGYEVGAPDDYIIEKYTSEIDKLLEKK